MRLDERRKPSHTLATEVGNQLRTERRNRNLTQTDVADAVGLKQSHWSKIERGLTAINMRQLGLAAGRLGVRPSDLVSAAEAMISWRLAQNPPPEARA
jgi:transcriptional regulator with XRE-family HTH domain